MKKSAQNPWQIRNSSVTYENGWIRVEHHEVRDASNRDGVYGIVRYKHATVATLAFDDRGNVCLVGQYRLPHETFEWELPGGGVTLGEDPLKGAARELMEEAGVISASWLALPPIHPSNGTTDEVAFAFLAWTLEYVETKPESSERLQLTWVPFGHVLRRVECGEIFDAVTVAAVLHVALKATRGMLPLPLAKIVAGSM